MTKSDIEVYFFIPLHDDKWNIVLIEKKNVSYFSNYPTQSNFFIFSKQKLTKSTDNCVLNFWTREGEKYINNLDENITTYYRGIFLIH